MGPVMLLMVSLDSLQTVGDGIMRGLTKQVLQFKVKTGAMWLIRMPSAVAAVFLVHGGLNGLWWASTMGMAASLSTHALIFGRMNWHTEVDRASSERKSRDSLEANLQTKTEGG